MQTCEIKNQTASKKKRGASLHLSQGCVLFLVGTEYMSVIAHVVIAHEQIACVFFVIEVERKITHHAVQIVALADDVIGEIRFRVKLALVGFVEAVNVEVMAKIDVIIKGFFVIFVEGGIFNDFVESVLIHAALAVKASGKILEVLEHQFRILLISVKLAADIQELVVVIKLGDVKPKSVIIESCDNLDGHGLSFGWKYSSTDS